MKTDNKTYKFNKEAKTGTEITCPVCGTKFIKKQYSQAFCSTQCKDTFWNKKGDRHKNPNYYSRYNQKHPERLSRIGVDPDDLEKKSWGFTDDEYDDDDAFMFCDNPILGI